MMEEKTMIGPDIPVLSQAEPSSSRLIGTLGVAGFLSGLILVGAYVLTLPIIESNKEKALQEAVYHVLPGCSRYEALVLQDGNLVKQDAADAASKAAPRIFLGYNERGAILGFAIPASESGFQDVIKLIYGYQPEGRVIVGFEVLDSKETPGLGDKIFKDRDFVANFTALAVEPAIEATPSGKKSRPNQVETITGATISSKAVIRALQKSLATWRPAIEKYIEANRLSYQSKP
jgi:electron transport complex protein RnfG